MKNHFEPRMGAVFSADIAVPEHARELLFYATVLTTGDPPLWRDDLMNNLGVPIIGLGERTGDYAELPLAWMPHFQVADVQSSAASAVDLGGRLVMDAKDESGKTQWAVLADPNGAAFGIIPVIGPGMAPQPDPHAGPIGRIAWVDLTVPDAVATRDFYTRVIGWESENVEWEDNGELIADYNMLDAAGTASAGVCHARGPNAALPPVWLLYLTVGDLEESLRRTRAQGGEVIRVNKKADGTAVWAVIADPVGVHVALVVPSEQSAS